MRLIQARFSACGVRIRLTAGIRQSAKHRFPSGRRICLTGVRIFIQPGQPFDAPSQSSACSWPAAGTAENPQTHLAEARRMALSKRSASNGLVRTTDDRPTGFLFEPPISGILTAFAHVSLPPVVGDVVHRVDFHCAANDPRPLEGYASRLLPAPPIRDALRRRFG